MSTFTLKNPYLSVAFLNVRSLRHKISIICTFIDNNSVDINGLPETWLDDTFKYLGSQ